MPPTALSARTAINAIENGQGRSIPQADGSVKDNQIVTKTDANGKVLESRDANAADKAGGINISISLGASKSTSETTQTSDSAARSTVSAGRNLTVTATGAGKDSDLTVQGSDLTAGRNATLSADDEIKLLAAQNTVDQHSTDKNSSASVGISYGTDGLLLNAGVSGGRGRADGQEVTWNNAHVAAGETLTLQSGGDTTLKGAVAQGEAVKAKVGGNLKLESLQDTSTYDAKQQSLGVSVSVGMGKMSGSVSASQSKIKSDYASVTEQTRLAAGDGGFDVEVKGHTDLAGAAIASTDTAVAENKNRFETGGTLSTSDIQNKAEYSASSESVNFGSATSFDGKLAPSGTGVGLGKDSGSASSTTQSGISGIAGNTAVRTGDKETGIAKIFDADKVQKEIQAQTQITQSFTQQANTAVETYANEQRAMLREKIKAVASNEDKAALQEQIKEINLQERVMNVLIGAVTGNGASALTKESLSVAAEQMRDLMIADSQKFAGVTDSTGKVHTNLSGPSEGIRGDGTKVGGTRFDLDLLCGLANERCTFQTNPDGSIDTTKPAVFTGGMNSDGTPKNQTIEDFLKTTEGQKMLGETGGLQGYKGSLFGTPYRAGSWQDKLVEAFSGSHDMIGGKLSGLYDEQGNIRRGMGANEKLLHDRWAEVAIPVAAPFAAAEGLSPEVWSAISILLKAAR